MKGLLKQEEEFINPYRENRRCFNKYFNNNSLYLKFSNEKNIEKKQPGDFLDNVSRTSSIKIRQNPFENQLIYQYEIKQEPQDMNFTKPNRRNPSLLQNPQIYNLISKHVDKNLLSNKKLKIISTRKSESQRSNKYERKSSFSIDQLKKTPKITEFSRQTFYSKSSSKQSFSSKKEKQDNLHSNNNLDINSQKISLCKKTFPWKQVNTFVACQVYMIKKRVGIDASLLTGSSKQIKFRLIMNQSDTKTFQLYWNVDPEQFIEKCIDITEHGIKLKLGVFNANNQSDIKISPLNFKQARKVYLKNYESYVKSKIKEKITPIRVGNIVFCQQYTNRTQKTLEKDSNNQKTQQQQSSQKIKINSQNFDSNISVQISQQKNPQLNTGLKSLEEVNQSIHFNNSSLKQIIQQNSFKVINTDKEIKTDSK